MKRSVKEGIRHAMKMQLVGTCTQCDGRGLMRLPGTLTYTSCRACDATGRGDIQRKNSMGTVSRGAQ